jgi:hypothetical protein
VITRKTRGNASRWAAPVAGFALADRQPQIVRVTRRQDYARMSKRSRVIG